MGEILSVAGWIALGISLGISGVHFYKKRKRKGGESKEIIDLIEEHFRPQQLDQLTILERRFPYRVRADLQRALDEFVVSTSVSHFCCIRREYTYGEFSLASCFSSSESNPHLPMPPQHEEIDIGDDEPIRCLKNGLWLLESGGQNVVLLLAPLDRYENNLGMLLQIGVANTPDGIKLAESVLSQLEQTIQEAKSYRGKILSLEGDRDYSYTGRASGIKVHKLRSVTREQVILPESTLSLLDRNILQFVRQRPDLRRLCQSTKKGLLFYGPPGTGKTHTIHYLTLALPGHTTLLITAEQVGFLEDYMTLARLLQPSIVVIEDVDLIAKDRTQAGPCEEALLNKLLNEMDGLKEQADILFVLTTNRPEALEQALAARPGRIDQAIEFPLPDEDCRGKLVRLYSEGLNLSEEVQENIVNRTKKVSAAFIKELMRRAVQFHLEHKEGNEIGLKDIESALEEMLFASGSLNLKLLGAAEATQLGFRA